MSQSDAAKHLQDISANKASDILSAWIKDADSTAVKAISQILTKMGNNSDTAQKKAAAKIFTEMGHIPNYQRGTWGHPRTSRTSKTSP